MAVANTVAASTTSSSANIGNAFQLIGHAQCKICVYVAMCLIICVTAVAGMLAKCFGKSSISACMNVGICLFYACHGSSANVGNAFQILLRAT